MSKTPTSHPFRRLKSFDAAMRGLVAVPKAAVERRENALKAARKKRTKK